MDLKVLVQPKAVEQKEGTFLLDYKSQIILEGEHVNLDTGKWLQENIEKTLGIRLMLNRSLNNIHGRHIYLKIEHGACESYQLTIDKECICICAADPAGLFYGVNTLCELMATYQVALPCLFIEDAPFFPVRGFYHDVTRGKVPTLETLKKLVDIAAFYKLNQLQLYVEHSFAFSSQSEVWMEADPLNAEEILLLDEYCQKRHIELVPSLSTFGHLYEALSSRSFHHLCELEGSLKDERSFIDRQRHHTLDVDNPESLEFVKDMLAQFIPLFSSNKFNICADETFDLGEGKNKKKAQTLGKGRLYVDFLNKIIEIVKSYDKQVLFWGDIIINYPELMHEVSNDAICLDWDYSKCPAEEKRAIIAQSGRTEYLCPSVVGWNTFMNDMDTAYSNITTMIDYGKKYHVEGILNTDWGDYGHINLFANLLPGMLYGAAMSWNPDCRDTLTDFNAKVSEHYYGDSTGQLVVLLQQLYGLQAITFREVIWWIERNDFEQIKSYSEKEVHQKYHKSIEIEGQLMGYLKKVSADKRVDIEEFIVSTKGVELFNALYLIVKKYELNEPIEQLIFEPKVLAEAIEYWFQDYSRLWRMRNKESELFRIKDTMVSICKKLREF
ncbi:family 20 glycosylhydrolase [Vallitaleaceae bacterium 9-2]